MATIAERYFHLAATDPDVIALVGYLWPGGLDDRAQLGARNLPQTVQRRLMEIGRQILGRGI